MTPIEELSEALSGKYRAIVVAERDVDLRPTSGANSLFLMKIAEGSLASGGRGGGFGERRVVRVSRFDSDGKTWERVFETEDENVLQGFEVPYHVSRIPFVLADGTEAMGYGVVDPPLVADFSRKAGPAK
ncbi:MAG: hypothetical protein HY296_03945 [Thaumarchaeota archaeon]|nr:hypothetical protein [Nitrososphaerota archaeon]